MLKLSTLPAVRRRTRHRNFLPRHLPLLLLLLLSLLAFFFVSSYRSSTTSTTGSSIAYFIQISPTNIVLLPPLLSALYHPSNHYLLHFDRSIPPPAMRVTLLHIYRRIPHSAIHILPSDKITYRGITMTLNYLTAMRYLLRFSWSHFINLSAADYPTATPQLMSTLLSSAEGRSFLAMRPRTTWRKFAYRRLGHLYIDPALARRNASYEETTLTNPIFAHLSHSSPISLSDSPLRVAKSSGWVILARDFVKYLLDSSFGQKVLLLFAYSDASDEHLFATVAYNTKWKRTIVSDNLRNIFFVAPNGSFAWHKTGKSRQHPFFVDAVDNNGEFLFWQSLTQQPGFFTRKLQNGRYTQTFRNKVDALVKDEAYQRRLVHSFNELLHEHNAH